MSDTHAHIVYYDYTHTLYTNVHAFYTLPTITQRTLATENILFILCATLCNDGLAAPAYTWCSPMLCYVSYVCIGKVLVH